MRSRRFASVLLLTLLSAAPALAQSRVRVPQDARTLEAAMSRVSDGGLIELAAGTYAAPPNGYLINNARKGFTIRAAGGAAVLSGGGTRPVFRFINSNRSRGKRVTFEGITFRDGASIENNKAGGMTLDKAEALFRNCAFLNNTVKAPSTGGGAVKVLPESEATFVNTRFEGNSSASRGGALVVRGATVSIQGGSFTGNRTNLPGHKINAAGGAIAVLNGTLQAAGVRFEGNQSGWTGGGIYAFGTWDGAGSNVRVTSSTFLDNQAVGDPCCTNPVETTGGAIHVEDKTTLVVERSRLTLNRAEWGGGISSYRADVEVHGSVLEANQTTRAVPDNGAGGAIAALSNDHADAATGASNRPSARLTVTHSLIRGGGGIDRVPHTGGCLFVEGDANRQYGENGLAPDGGLDVNRARLVLRNVVLDDCDVENARGATAFGGALLADLVDLTMEDSMVRSSDARGSEAGGGGLMLREDSRAVISRTTFVGNSAERWGGAIFVLGSELIVGESRFFGNEVVPGSEPLQQSRGAAILANPSRNPARPRNVTGVVANSVFSENPGLPIWDLDGDCPVNDLHYDGNRFNPGAFGDLVYFNSVAASGGLNVTGLNNLVVNHGGCGSVDKSRAPNTRVSGPREGALVAVPSPDAVGAGPSTPNAALLAYAWSGRSAKIGAQAVGTKHGLLSVAPGDHTLSVDSTNVATVKVGASCTTSTSLCLNGNRFRAEVTWKNGGTSGPGRAVDLSGDTGYFWFFNPENAELVVKVLDGRGLNGHFWVFYGALTNVEYTLRVTDTQTDTFKEYRNPAGKFASAGDTSAFPAPKSLDRGFVAGAADLGSVSAEAFACAAGPASLCLNASRFQVGLTWKDGATTRTAQAVPLTSDTGYFWFSAPSNVEVIVKVLDGRGLNGHFWVFFGALTDREYTLTVTDTQTGFEKTYTNPLGKFASRGDTNAVPSN
jgi:hypothetical protein